MADYLLFPFLRDKTNWRFPQDIHLTDGLQFEFIEEVLHEEKNTAKLSTDMNYLGRL